jgi:hypothetical protein
MADLHVPRIPIRFALDGNVNPIKATRVSDLIAGIQSVRLKVLNVGLLQSKCIEFKVSIVVEGELIFVCRRDHLLPGGHSNAVVADNLDLSNSRHGDYQDEIPGGKINRDTSSSTPKLNHLFAMSTESAFERLMQLIAISRYPETSARLPFHPDFGTTVQSHFRIYCTCRLHPPGLRARISQL